MKIIDMKKHRILNSFVLALMVMLYCSFSVFANTTIPEKPSDESYLDLAEIIAPTTIAQLDAVNAELGNTASIYIVTVKSTGDLTAEEFASSLYEEWNSNVRNSILLLVDTDTPTYFSIVGADVKDKVTQAELRDILDENVEPEFIPGNYSNAISEFILNVSNEVKGISTIPSTSSQADNSSAESTDIENSSNSSDVESSDTAVGTVSSIAPTSTTAPESNVDTEGSFFESFWAVFKVILITILVIIILLFTLTLLLGIRANNIKKKRRAQMKRRQAKVVSKQRSDFTDINSRK